MIHRVFLYMARTPPFGQVVGSYSSKGGQRLFYSYCMPPVVVGFITNFLINCSLSRWTQNYILIGNSTVSFHTNYNCLGPQTFDFLCCAFSFFCFSAMIHQGRPTSVEVSEWHNCAIDFHVCFYVKQQHISVSECVRECYCNVSNTT